MRFGREKLRGHSNHGALKSENDRQEVMFRQLPCAFVCYYKEAQLPQRDSASATHVFLGSLTDRTLL